MYFTHLQFKDMISLESKDPTVRNTHNRIVIGHNVGFDRAYIKEQYYVDVSFISSNKCLLF
jgi:hypothetical protein